MECSCGVCWTKMPRRSFKRPITAFLVLISQGPKLEEQNPEIGYYWLLALHDQGLHDYARRFDARQFMVTTYIHQTSEPLYPTVSSWSFEAWGWTSWPHQTSLSPLPYAVLLLAAFVASLSFSSAALTFFTYCLPTTLHCRSALCSLSASLLSLQSSGFFAPLITHLTRQPNLFIHYSNINVENGKIRDEEEGQVQRSVLINEGEPLGLAVGVAVDAGPVGLKSDEAGL
ncbi:hypothetical protein GH714_043966 [Hevea brasiliensis]|uniref:Uncharacterized protein n=1 Tax=Hevea brasiliensis TaxID=3981 RepID=A0A6A6K0J2_HEVBR|nr:hypothetical protein GH714_043966 [Hevea brasiliensis]